MGLMEEMPAPEEILRSLEQRLLQPDARNSTADLDVLLAADFLGFGSSGRIYDKRQVIAALQQETPTLISLTDFRAKNLTPEIVLVTYRARQSGATETPAGYSLRSSLWQVIEGRWQLVFHQGTTRNAPQ